MPGRMSKKTYEEFAAMLREVEMPGRVRDELTGRMIRVFKADNSGFHVGKFVDAVEGDGVRS